MVSQLVRLTQVYRLPAPFFTCSSISWGLVAVAVSCRPLIHLELRPAGEPQQLSPVAFHEEQHTGNSTVLGIIGIPKGFAGHMDVQTTGACLMRQIPLCDGLAQYLVPRHFVELILQRHGMRHDLKAVVQTAIVLAVSKGVLPVSNVQQGRGVLVVLACAVDLQLYAEKAGPGAVEDGTGLEIVIMDSAVFNVGAAVTAIGIVIVVRISSAIKGNKAAAAGAAGVIAVAAVGTDRVSVVVGQAFTLPEPGAAVDADLGHFLQTVRAKQAVMELDQVVGGTAAAGAGANRCGHSEIPPEYRNRPPGITRRPSSI